MVTLAESVGSAWADDVENRLDAIISAGATETPEMAFTMAGGDVMDQHGNIHDSTRWHALVEYHDSKWLSRSVEYRNQVWAVFQNALMQTRDSLNQPNNYPIEIGSEEPGRIDIRIRRTF